MRLWVSCYCVYAVSRKRITSYVSELTGDNRFYCSAALCVFSSGIGQSNQLCANTRMKRHSESMFPVFICLSVCVGFCYFWQNGGISKKLIKTLCTNCTFSPKVIDDQGNLCNALKINQICAKVLYTLENPNTNVKSFLHIQTALKQQHSAVIVEGKYQSGKLQNAMSCSSQVWVDISAPRDKGMKFLILDVINAKCNIWVYVSLMHHQVITHRVPVCDLWSDVELRWLWKMMVLFSCQFRKMSSK